MKILLTEKEAQQVELAALQKLVQDKIQNMIDKRVEEMTRELDSFLPNSQWEGEPTYTLADIHKKFLGSKSVIDVSPTQKSILVPAGLEINQKKV